MNGELEQLGERIAEQAAHLDAATHRLLADLREFDERGGWHAQGAASCAHWLAWRVGWDLVTARDHVRVARKLAEFPLIDDALRRGELSYSKVRALLRVATPENESLFLDHARLLTASQLEKTCRKYALVQRHGQDAHPQVDEQRRHVRRRDLEDGMVKIEAVLHPEEAELVWKMLDHAATRLSRNASMAASTITSAPVTAGPIMGSAAATTHDAVATTHDAVAATHGAVATTHGAAVTTGAMLADKLTVVDDAATSAGAAAADTAAASGGALGTASVAVAATGVATADAMAVAAQPVGHDSAESRDVPSVTDPEAGQAWQTDAACGSDHSAACFQEPAHSLLDRLLNEAEALRDSESAAAESAAAWVPEARDRFGDRVDSATQPYGSLPGLGERSAGWPSHANAAPRMQQISARDTCVLRDRAAAAKKAFNRADALVELAQAYLRGDRPERPPIEVTLTVPVNVLRDEDTDTVEVGEIGESFVSRDTARRLSCDAGIVEIIEDEQGAPLSVGRKRRTIAGALRRALHRRDGTCTYPGCTNRLFLEGHHIQHWADGGETSLRNTALLCSLHHRHVHELGYTVDLGPDQRPRFRDPLGRLVAAAPERVTPADLGWPWIRATNAALAIDAGTIAGPWDGTPVDYPRIVGHLVAADGLA
ncbi:MAG TPA: DUF222 domain-containing protein [Kofleriaceae bacterium]|jgi:hypothetical protein|nr:DUF222 domain-containing protein [Kofleriaceae bacterium]